MQKSEQLSIFCIIVGHFIFRKDAFLLHYVSKNVPRTQYELTRPNWWCLLCLFRTKAKQCMFISNCEMIYIRLWIKSLFNVLGVPRTAVAWILLKWQRFSTLKQWSSFLSACVLGHHQQEVYCIKKWFGTSKRKSFIKTGDVHKVHKILILLILLVTIRCFWTQSAFDQNKLIIKIFLVHMYKSYINHEVCYFWQSTFKKIFICHKFNQVKNIFVKNGSMCNLQCFFCWVASLMIAII